MAQQTIFQPATNERGRQAASSCDGRGNLDFRIPHINLFDFDHVFAQNRPRDMQSPLLSRISARLGGTCHRVSPRIVNLVATRHRPKSSGLCPGSAKFGHGSPNSGLGSTKSVPTPAKFGWATPGGGTMIAVLRNVMWKGRAKAHEAHADTVQCGSEFASIS